MIISAEMSLYALGVEDYGLPVSEFIFDLEKFNLEVSTGNMSTVVSGDTAEVFKAVTYAFEQVSGKNHVVLIIKISNACPL